MTDVTTGPLSTSVPTGILIAALAAVLLLVGGGVSLIAIYNRIRNGIIATVSDVIDLRMTKHEKEELEARAREIESRERLLYNFKREVDVIKRDLDRLERAVDSLRERGARRSTDRPAQTEFLTPDLRNEK